MRSIGEEAWQARADHSFAAKAAELVPDDALILSHDPNMFLVWGKNAAQISSLTNDPRRLEEYRQRFPGGVFFYYDFWCSVQDPVQQQFCVNVLKDFKTTLLNTFQERNVFFRLYRIDDTLTPLPAADKPRRHRSRIKA